MRTILALLLLTGVALAADPSYVVVGRLAQTPDGQSSAPEIAAVTRLLGSRMPPIPVARAREGTVATEQGPARFVGFTVPFASLSRIVDLGLEPAPADFSQPPRGVH